MRARTLAGSALALAVLALGSTQAGACDDDCDRCGGYGYYAAAAYYAAPAYYARPAFAYAPPAYYAAPAYAYAPPAYYAPSPAYYAPPAYGHPYARPYYLGRGGYVDATRNGRPRGDVLPGNVAKRGIYASAANPGPRVIKAPAPNYNAVKVSVFPAKQKKPGSHVPAAGYAVQGKHIPTAYYVGPGGYIGPRR
jgi:hypothetical protein